jgi:hypothetical protein
MFLIMTVIHIQQAVVSIEPHYLIFRSAQQILHRPSCKLQIKLKLWSIRENSASKLQITATECCMWK